MSESEGLVIQPTKRWRWHHIPPCGGLHGLAGEQHCYDCHRITYQEEKLRLIRRTNELLEMQLEIGPMEPRKRTYTPPVATPEPKAPTIQRRGV